MVGASRAMPSRVMRCTDMTRTKSAADFVRVMSVQRVSQAGLARLASTIVPLARAEGLEAHAESIEVRLK